MARFSQTTKSKNIIENYEGGKAYSLTPEMELYTAICCASLQPKFYVDNVEDELSRIRELLKNVDVNFSQKLAIYARTEMYLRSIPLVICVELAKLGKLNSETVESVIQRADEIVELLSYYQIANNRTETKKLNKLSKAIQKGIKHIFENGKFDEYQYSKYNRKTDIKLRDALFLTHPKAQNAEQQELFKKIADNTLEVPYTWETQLSERGNTKEVWEELIDSKKVGYMALLRNLRNILQAEVSTIHLEKVCNYLSDPAAVKKSKQLPFRFLSAYRELKEIGSPYTSSILECLEEAIKISTENINGFGLDTAVLIACDVSGSMQQTISPRSTVQYYDIGLMLGMLLQSKCKAVISGMFGDIWKVIQLPRNNILANADQLHRREGEVGYSTNGWKILDWLIETKTKIDKIMIFTDCQMWDSTDWHSDNSGMSKLWNSYKQIYPEAKIYLFDLAGYGNTPLDIRQNDVFLIAGWSDKIFDVLNNIEKGNNVISFIKG